MSEYNIEKGLISKLLETKDINLVKDQQIKNNFFSRENKEVFKFINDYYYKTGEVPTIRIIETNFPKYVLDTYTNLDLNEVIGTEEPLMHWCNEIRKKTKHNKLVDNIEIIIEDLETMETERAYDKLKKTLMYLENEVVLSTSVDITKDIEDRKLLYKQRKENKGMIGIPTGIDKLDYILKGMQKKQLITLIARTGVGKANPLSTPVLTPTGFVPMKDIKVNDYIIGEDGNPHKVTAIYLQGIKEVYEITFSDGTKSRSCKEHLWKYKTTDDRVRNKPWRVDTLEDIMKKPILRRKAYNLVIPVCKPINFKSVSELKLNPYVLGVLLGDGGFTTDRISLTSQEEDIISKCNTILKDWGHFKLNSSTKIQYNFKSNNPRVNKLYRTIGELNLLKTKSNTKFIPNEYLYASIEDRKLLLQGLFDTDGSINPKGGYSFSTTSPQLKEDVMFLCRSLGYRVTFSDIDRTHEDKSIEYRIRISTDDIIFSSFKHTERYNNRIIPKKKHDYNVLKIVDIQKVDDEECQCISVDSDDHTYLIDDFVVTHNTWVEIILGANALLNNYRVLQFTTEMSEEQLRDRYEAMLIGIMEGEFNYNKFKSGSLSLEQEKRYLDFLDNTLPKLEPMIIETATGVTNMAAKIDQYKPDLVLVDSAYLMEDDRGAKEDWLRVAHITRDIKNLAKIKNIPIFINSQADSTTSKKTGPELENIGFAKAIGQDSDVVLSLFRDEYMLEDREMKLKILKQREGILGSVMLNWDFSTMNFSPIYSESQSGNEIVDGEEVETETNENLIKV